MVNRLFDSYTGTPTCGSNANNQEIGSHFRPAVDTYLREVRWYRCSTTADAKPIVLRIWDEGIQGVIYTVPAVPDNGAVGWQTYAVPVDVLLSGNRTYWVTGQWPANKLYAYDLASNLPTAPYPLVFVSTARGYHTLGSYGYPNLTDATFLQLIEVGVDTASPTGSSAATPGDVQNALASWLSVDDATHADSAPVLTLAQLLDATSGLAALAEWFADVTKDGALSLIHDEAVATSALLELVPKIGETDWSKVGDIWKLYQGVSDAELAVWQAFFHEGNAKLDDVLAVAGGEADTLTGTAGSAVGALSARSGFPGDGWAMADEVDFVQAKSWDVPADLYTLSTSDWPVNIRQNLVDGAPWRPRLGWWAVRNGDLFGSRRFVDWEASILEDGGRRMPGVVVWLEPSTAGTLQAWRLT